LTSVPLWALGNASPFWIILLLVSTSFGHQRRPLFGVQKVAAQQVISLDLEAHEPFELNSIRFTAK
jgi:hypothetical protein